MCVCLHRKKKTFKFKRAVLNFVSYVQLLPKQWWTSLFSLNPYPIGPAMTSFSCWLLHWCLSNDVSQVDNWLTFWGRPGLIRRDGIHSTSDGAALCSRSNLAKFRLFGWILVQLGISVWRLYVLHVSPWIFSGYSSFPSTPKTCFLG